MDCDSDNQSRRIKWMAARKGVGMKGSVYFKRINGAAFLTIVVLCLDLAARRAPTTNAAVIWMVRIYTKYII